VVGGAPSVPEQKPQNMTAFVGGNISKGIADVAGLPVDLAQSAIEGVKGLANLGGAGLKETQAPVGGSEWIKQKLSQIGSIGPSAEPRGRGQRLVAAGLEAGPSAVLPGGGAKALSRIGSAFGSGVGGQAAEEMGAGPWGKLLGSAVGGGVGGIAGAERGIPKPPSEAARASQASGIPLTIGQETGNKPLLGTENKLRELFTSAGVAHADALKQAEAGATSVNRLADQLSAQQGVPGELQQASIGEKLRFAYKNTVDKIDTMRDTNATRDYGEVRKLAGDKPVIGYQNTMDTLDKIIAENENVPAADSRKVVAQARSIKDALTVTTPGAPASKILGLSGAPAIPAAPPTTGAATHSINDAMKTRSAWGKAARRSGNIFSDIDPNANQVLAKRLFGAINKDFEAASTAQTPIARAMKAANQNYAKASQSLAFIEKSALGKLLGEDVTDAAFTGVQGSTKAPEAIAKKYLSMTPSQARTVTAILKVHQPEVLQDAKAFVLRNGLEQAKSDVPGALPISFAKFRSQIDKVAPKLKQMGFSDKEIKDIKDVTDTMARAGDRTGKNPSGTAASAQAGGIVGAAFVHPLAAIGAAGLPYVAAKALLTSKGRDLLRAAMNSTNGKAQAAAIGSLRGLLPAASQSGANAAPASGSQLASPPQ
jgi:hypothetical protein